MAVVAASWHLNSKLTFEALKHEFEKDPGKAWRNFGSKITIGTERPIDPDVVNRNASRDRAHPWDEAAGNFYSWFRGSPDHEYFVHLDLAKNHDAAGVACVHQDRATQKLVVDFMDGVVGKNGRDVQIADLRETYVYGLTARGFNIKRVTLDQWNSLDTIQLLAKRGYLSDETSADKTTGPYDTLFELMNTNRLDYYLHPRFIREIIGLRRYPKKYDHQRTGSKDVADAVACAAFNAIQDAMEHPYTGPSVITVHRAVHMKWRRGID